MGSLAEITHPWDNSQTMQGAGAWAGNPRSWVDFLLTYWLLGAGAHYSAQASVSPSVK